MSRNNQNNSTAWAKRVREYDVIPDDGPSSVDESWKRLQKRYENKPAKRRAYFYWAAAAVIAVIAIPILWKWQSSNTDKGSIAPIVVKPAIKGKSPEMISKPDSQQLIVHENKTRKDLLLKKNKPIPVMTKNQFTIKHEKDTAALVFNNDSLSVNKSLTILNNKPDTVSNKKNISIVHINKINSDQPQTEVDNRKLRRFIRRYDVDVPNKTDATGSTNGTIIKNIN